jgi:hypothetical protein
MRPLLLLAITLVIAACSSSDVVETTVPTQGDPVVAAADWIRAVGSLDTSALERLVEPRGLAVVAGVESNLRAVEFVALVDSGVTEALGDRYWSQFRDDFLAFSGTSVPDLTVGEQRALDTPGFTAVALEGDDGSAWLILRQTDTGWQVDFPATIGPALIGPLGQYLASAADGANAAPIAAAYRDYVTPGLDAALALDPGNTRLQFEAEYIRQVAESIAPSP